jgi:tetratricopeptide (TPR) repeat protein
MGLWLDFWEDDAEAADAEFRRALEIDPRHSNAQREYARFLMRRGRFDESLREIEKVQDPIFAVTVHLTRAEVYRYRGQYAEAMREAHRFQEIWSGSDEPLLQKVLCYIALVEYEKAAELVQQISSDHPARYRLVALINILQGHTDQAKVTSEQLLSRQPDSSFAWWLSGQISFLADDYEKARESFSRAHQLKTTEDLNWWRPFATYLGVTLWRLGERDAAEQLFSERISANQSAFEKGNQDPELRRDMAVIHATRGETEEALQWMERAFEAGYARYDLIQKDRLLEALYDHPRFQELVVAMRAGVSQMRRLVGLMEQEWKEQSLERARKLDLRGPEYMAASSKRGSAWGVQPRLRMAGWAMLSYDGPEPTIQLCSAF